MNTKFLIRGSRVSDVLEKLSNGRYNSLRLKYDKSREEKETIINESEGVYVITKRGRKVIVAAKGHQIYVNFVCKGKYTNSPCMWCKTLIQDDPIGLPVGNMKMIVVDSNTRLICYIEDLYCTFECLYASFQMFYSRKDCYDNSEEMILHLFNMIYPGEILEPADDWRVLKSNNGWMSTEQFKEKTHRFVDTGKIILVPIKRIYELTQ
uniref:A1L transcription factor/late transcription factor VLTF-2 n=1 Tax=Pithovirus LCPAC406 TaxID=2506599 RepID=A0A481ZD56_9VIRU|nr:MAG: A1L transcription factor/late transcription factor VLTF-2 [Pithovirus LCPAC406]